MSVTAKQFIDLYKFPLGRAVFALRRVADEARKLGWLELEQLARRAADDVQHSLSLAMRFQATSDTQYSPLAIHQDKIVDRSVGGVALYLDVQIRMYEGEPRGEAAARLTEELFSDGVAAITQLPFTEEHEHINVLIDLAESPELAADVALLPEFPGLIARLRERNREYGELLKQPQTSPTREQIRELHADAQERLAEVVALIIGQHAVRQRINGVTGTADRDALLAPILHQNNALALSHRRHRPVADVNPDTGDELPGTDTPASEPADSEPTPEPTPGV